MGAAVRAVAGKPDLEVSFSADRPLLTADKARLANLPRLPTRRDIAIARGQGDAMAMRLASHNPDIHRKRSPAEPEARAAFDALEQARVEALGCIRMPGGPESEILHRVRHAADARAWHHPTPGDNRQLKDIA